MASAAQFRIEHLAKKPRGWRVRSVTRAGHVARIAFPPGRRHKGSGKLVELLHPKKENPCTVSNPSELLIFTNPSNPDLVGEHRGVQMFYEGISYNAPSLKLWGYSTDLALQRAINRKLKAQEKKAAGNPKGKLYELIEIDAGDKTTVLRTGLTRADARERLDKLRAAYGGSGLRYIIRREQVGGNPTKRELQRAARERAARIRGARLNPTKAERAAAYRQAIQLAKKGDLAGAQPYIDKMQPAITSAEFSNLIRSAPSPFKKINPRGKTIPEILRECDKIRAASRYRMGRFNPKVSHTYKIVKERPPHRGSGPWAGYVYSADGRQVWSFGGFHTKASAAQHARQRIREFRGKKNPSQLDQAIVLYESFHGKDAKEVTELHESAAVRQDYTALGKLVAIGIGECKRQGNDLVNHWDRCGHLCFEKDGVTLAASPNGKQLYCIGGNQDLSLALSKVDLDRSKDFLDLGELPFIVYEARKVHGNFAPTEYVHEFGEKSGVLPKGMYDKLRRRIYFVGGEYFIDTRQGVSPGIEN